MPTYDYHCEQCGNQFEQFQKITDPALETCPSCQTPHLKRGPGGGIGLVFKGEGFYINDYAKKKPEADQKNTKTSKSECCPCGKASKCESTNR